MAKRFETASVGDLVWWYPDPNENQPPFPAIVMAVGMSGLQLHIMAPENRNFMTKDGVRHINDEAAKSTELQEAGCWRHTDDKRLLNDLVAEILGAKKPKEKEKAA